jgi:phospholipase C
MLRNLRRFLIGMAALTAGPAYADLLPVPDHVVVVIEENKSYSGIIGNPNAPYINQLAQAGALFTNSYGIEHPSQPNYLHLFSGSNQGVFGDPGISGLGRNGQPSWPFTAPNLGAQLLSHGKTFIGYSESMPYVGYTGDGDLEPRSDKYAAKHNPWVMFQNDQPTSPHQLPSSVNRPLTDFPTDYSKLPTVSFVIPNDQNNMHNNNIPQGDTWLRDNLNDYYLWAQTHNSLLIVTFDEDDNREGNRIPTIFLGQMVHPGQYDEYIDHYSVLRMLEDMYGLGDEGYLGGAADRAPITGPFVPEPATLSLLAVAVFGLVLVACRKRAVV